MTPRLAVPGRVVRLAADVLLALALSLLSVTLLATWRALPWPAIPLAVLHTLPLAARRRAPLAASAVAVAAAFGYVVLGYPMVGLGPAALVWLYTIGSHVRRPASYVLLALSQAVVAVAIGVGGAGDAGTWVADAIALAVAYLLGDSARRRRDVLALHRARADELERTQAEVARRAVAEERLRIARELHDVVAHGMSVIAVQAGTGRLVLDTEPERAREALAVIERTSRGALEEMRRLLGVLRDDGATGRAPAPGLDAVDELVARTVAAGVPVSVRVEGERRPLPAGLELTAYRIVQEALTNVARHAPGAAATVVLAYTGTGLRLSVANAPAAGAGAAPDGAGLGLVGMRERAALYGGTVSAGPAGDGGFLVEVELEAGR